MNCDAEFTKYFQSFGLKVGWDWNTRAGIWWYEISDTDGHLLIQIDGGVPVSRIIEDAIHDYKGEAWSEGSDYKICGPTDSWIKVRDQIIKHEQTKV